ncbi:MAG TPA: phosphoribosyltransferase family protein [Devosia sp.]|nr:phosphoribosyltransferase family protein [Devosia sp.]
MIFTDRTDAGRRLLAEFQSYRTRNPLVLALPRGGVPVAAEIARGLDAELGLLIVRKIGVPVQPELAMGAVVDAVEPVVVRNEDIIRAGNVSEAEFDRVLNRELAELARRRTHYLGDRPQPAVEDRVVIVVDDGLATGTTMLAALRALRRQSPAEVVVAVPVGAADAIKRIAPFADDIVCLESSDAFGAIGFFYRDFAQLSDDDVISALDTARRSR